MQLSHRVFTECVPSALNSGFCERNKCEFLAHVLQSVTTKTIFQRSNKMETTWCEVWLVWWILETLPPKWLQNSCHLWDCVGRCTLGSQSPRRTQALTAGLRVQPFFSSARHLQKRTTSCDIGDPYKWRTELRARNVLSIWPMTATST
jgi:hypothetical protein